MLTIIMFNNLYPLSSTGYMNLKRALFLHDLITDEEIDICTHIFHILCKTVARTDLRTCIPFCCLVSRILKLEGIRPSDDESPYTKPSPINIRTLNASIGHSRKGIKTETSASHSGSRSTSSSYDEKFDNIMASMTYAIRCPDLPLSCTITPSVVIQSSLLSKPNWTKFKGS